MKHFDFDKIVPRRGNRSYKWDSAAADDVLPLWVADMDFRMAPPVVEALERRVRHGIFGYTKVSKEYYDATLEWFRRRHRWQMEREWILYTTGGVPALSALIKALTNPGDRILVQTPVYNCFFSFIRNNGCELVTSELVCENGIYRMDYADMERKMQDPKLKVMLLCNPHNPVGRVWTRKELTRMGEICLRNGVFVIADEIHCELVHPGHTYTPFASIDGEFLNHSATSLSPTKAFNLAGLQIANIIIADSEIRRRTDRAININEVFKERGIDLPLEPQAIVTEDNRHAEGLKVRQPLYGDETRKAMASLPEGMDKAVPDFLTEMCFGDFYTRKALDVRARELLTMCVLATLGVERQLASHATGSLKAGNSKATLYAAMIQCLPYIGFPNALNAIRVIQVAEEP